MIKIRCASNIWWFRVVIVICFLVRMALYNPIDILYINKMIWLVGWVVVYDYLCVWLSIRFGSIARMLVPVCILHIGIQPGVAVEPSSIFESLLCVANVRSVAINPIDYQWMPLLSMRVDSPSFMQLFFFCTFILSPSLTIAQFFSLDSIIISCMCWNFVTVVVVVLHLVRALCKRFRGLNIKKERQRHWTFLGIAE